MTPPRPPSHHFCAHCGAAFISQGRRSLKRYCSLTCRNRATKARYVALHKDRVRRGICKTCGAADASVGQRCPPCAARNCESTKRQHAERIAAGLCSRCGTAPPRPGLLACSPCAEAQLEVARAAWQRGKGDGSKRYRARYLLKKYGLSQEQYDAMLAAQGGRCGLCGSADAGGQVNQFAVDHDHKTGALRDLLCCNCNLGLGKFRESEDLLLKAIEYLRKHRELKSVGS